MNSDLNKVIGCNKKFLEILSDDIEVVGKRVNLFFNYMKKNILTQIELKDN